MKIKEVDIVDKKIIGRVQGFGRLSVEKISELEFSGFFFHAKRRVKKLVRLGFLKNTGIDQYQYTGKEVI